MRTILKTGKRVHLSWLQLVFQQHTFSAPRFAFIVSNRIDKRSTVRNRMKRLLAESVHHLLPSLSPADVIIQVKSKPPEDSQKAVEKLVGEACTLAGLL